MDGVLIGLNHASCQISLAHEDLDHPEVWEGLRIIEQECVAASRKK